MTVYTDAQLEALRDPTRTNVDAAAAVGVSESTVRRWRKNNGIVVAPRAPMPADVTTGPTDEEILRAEVRELRAALRKTDRANVGDERVIRAIEQAAAQVAPRPWAPSEKALRMMTRRELREEPNNPHHTQVALWSDWHYGETVSRAQMNGINEFNVTIAEDRIDQLVTSMLAFRAVRPALTSLNLFLLGDMASGAIHALEETNEIPAAEQYVRVGHLIGDAIEKLAPHYPHIDCSGIVGNHPRPGKEPASKNAYNNGDWIAYQMAKARTTHLDNVTWDIPTGGMLIKRVAGNNFLLWHGDGVRSSMPGVPWGGIARRVNVLKDTYAARGIRIDHVVVGHFHQRCIVPGVYMNGSLVGPNEYSLKNFGGGEPPKQLLVTFDEKRSRETDVSTLSFEETGA